MMRLSDIKGEQTFDVLADVFESVCSMANDKRVLQALRPRKLPKGVTTRELGVQIAIDTATVIVKYHKEDCIKLMSSLSGETEDEYLAHVDGISLIQDVFDLLSDPELQTLFFSQTGTSGSDSGSVSDNTQAPEA